MYAVLQSNPSSNLSTQNHAILAQFMDRTPKLFVSSASNTPCIFHRPIIPPTTFSINLPASQNACCMHPCQFACMLARVTQCVRRFVRSVCVCVCLFVRSRARACLFYEPNVPQLCLTRNLSDSIKLRSFALISNKPITASI